MRRAVELVIDGLTECDLFSAGVVLRYRKDDNFKTLTSGCISFIIIGLLTTFFVTNIIGFVNKNNVSISEIVTESDIPTAYSTTTDSFLFAIGLSGVNLNSGNRYFNIKLTTVSVINGTKSKPTLNMQACTREQWSRFGGSFDALYDKLSLNQWMCPVPGQTIELEGKYTSDVFKYMKISVSTCSGTVNGYGCRTAAEISSFLLANDYFNLNYYFVNDRKQYTQDIPMSNYLEDKTTFVFSPDMGSTANIYYSTIHVDTDDSLLPTSSVTSSYDGKSTASHNVPASFYKPYQNEYLKLYIRKAAEDSSTSRSYLKIDAMLSNVGGLFSIVLMLLQLPLYYYNSYCYELSLASDLFTYEKKEDQEKDENTTDDQTKISMFQKMSNKFNFLVYLAYLPFVLIRKLRCKPNWKYFSALFETQHEIRRMTDVCRMMQRLQYLDRVCRLLLDEDQRRLIHLQQKETIQEIRKERNHYKLYRKMVADTSAPMPLISLALKSNQIQKDTITRQQREVINSYNVVRTNKVQLNQTIIAGLDRDVVGFLNQTQKAEEDRKKRRLALQRSLTIDSRDSIINSSIMRLEDVGPDSSEPTPVYRFYEHQRARY